MSEQTQFVIRKQSDWANTYGLGEEVVPRVFLFRDDNYNLSKDEVEAKYRKVTTPVVQQ